MSDFTYLNVVENALDYHMGHKKPGKCLIFNHEHFDKLKQRKGTEVDVERIISFFEGKLGFEVKDSTYHDSTKRQLIERTQKMANEDFTDYNCFVCCILTHGDETHLNARDGEYQLDQIISFFRAERCPSLAGKPKLFFIQACQGSELDPGQPIKVIKKFSSLSATNSVKTEELTNVDNNTIVTVRIPICADIMVAFSTVPKHYSFRNISTGSWFFEVLIKVLEEHYEEHDLLTILTITKRKIAFEKESNSPGTFYDNKKQIPWITDTLTRRVFFRELAQKGKK